MGYYAGTGYAMVDGAGNPFTRSTVGGAFGAADTGWVAGTNAFVTGSSGASTNTNWTVGSFPSLTSTFTEGSGSWAPVSCYANWPAV